MFLRAFLPVKPPAFFVLQKNISIWVLNILFEVATLLEMSNNFFRAETQVPKSLFLSSQLQLQGTML